MATPNKKLPAFPPGWQERASREITAPGIGEGFARFDEPGQYLRGILRQWFSTAFGPAVSVELTEEPTCVVHRTTPEGEDEVLTPGIGDLVNVSLSGIDLARKLTSSLQGEEVGILYSHDVPTRAGSLKVYRVVVFEPELPI